MDFREIARSSYSWVSKGSIVWFLVFFWVSLPFIIILPQFFQSGLVYSGSLKSIALALYNVLYVILFLGVIALINFAVSKRDYFDFKVRARNVVDLVFLVFVELFYIFVWNINIRFRKLQLLFLVASALLCLVLISTDNIVALVLFSWALLGYFALVIRNAVMLFFSTSILINKPDISLKEAVRESWALTHSRVALAFSSILIAFAIAFLIFVFITLALGAVAAIALSYFFINSIALSMGFKIAAAFSLGVALVAYHFMIAEIYSQLHIHRHVSTKIRHALARRVLSGKHPALAVRRFAKKKKRK